MSSPNVLTHAQYVLINRLAVPLGGFVLLIIIARHSDRLLGQYALVMTFYFIMQMLPLLGLTSFVMREVARAPEQAGRFFVTIGAMSLLGCVATDAACYVFILFSDYDPAVSTAIAVVGLLIFPGILAFIAEIIFMSVNLARPVAQVAVVENLVRVAASATVLMLDYGVIALVLVLCVTRFGALVTYVIVLSRSGVVRRFELPDPALLRRTFKVLPVFLWGSIVFTVLSRMEFLVLSVLESVELLGYYAIGYRLFEVFVIILTALVMAMFPWVSRNFVGARKQYLVALRGIVTAFTGGLIVLAAIVVLFAEYYVLWLFPEQYPSPVALSRLFAAALLVAGLDFVASGILHASDQQSPDVRAATVGGALLTVLLLLLIPQWGIYGAFAAKIIATTAQTILKFAAIQGAVGAVNNRADLARLIALSLLIAIPSGLGLEASLISKLALSLALVLLVPMFMFLGGAVQPLRMLRYYRRPRAVDDVATITDLLDMLVSDDRRYTRTSGANHKIGLSWRSRVATILYRLARFLFLNRYFRLSNLFTRLNSLLTRITISANIKAGPGLLIVGSSALVVTEDLDSNTTLGQN